MPSEERAAFYRRVLEVLENAGIPYLVGGGFALEHHTGIHRESLDFDVFVLPEDAPRALERLAEAGMRTEFTFPHWLGKVYRRRCYADIIFSSGNGVARVDRAWFEHATVGPMMGRTAPLCPIEEMIWSKSFVMERERFDGADVLHLIRAGGERLDWNRLLSRFGSHWRVLLAHLVLFGYVYPAEQRLVPETVRHELVARLDLDALDPGDPRICRGTLLSRSQYLPDLARGLLDGREVEGTMSASEIARWTAAAQDR